MFPSLPLNRDRGGEVVLLRSLADQQQGFLGRSIDRCSNHPDSPAGHHSNHHRVGKDY